MNVLIDGTGASSMKPLLRLFFDPSNNRFLPKAPMTIVPFTLVTAPIPDTVPVALPWV